MIKIAAIIDKLLSLFQYFITKHNEAKAQKARYEIENDPYNWFDAHFNGVPESTRKTTDADKANTKDSAQ
jgi:hypothetical protein